MTNLNWNPNVTPIFFLWIGAQLENHDSINLLNNTDLFINETSDWASHWIVDLEQFSLAELKQKLLFIEWYY